MIPIENNLGGRVADIHQLLPHQALHIVAEHFQPVRHELLAVQAQASRNCGRCTATLRHWRNAGVFCANRALNRGRPATRRRPPKGSRSGGDPTVAALASRLAGELYQLASLRSDIQDEHHNTTRFIVLARERNEEPPDAATRYISALWFQLRSVPAALYKALGAFATNNVNLTKLESYIGMRRFDRARFYVEIEGHETDDPVCSALEELKYFADLVRVLGSFPQHQFRQQQPLR